MGLFALYGGIYYGVQRTKQDRCKGGYLCQGIDIAPDRQGFSAYAEARPARIRKTDVEYR